MPKIKKTKVEKNRELHKQQKLDESFEKHQQDQATVKLMDSKQKKLSEGALFIFNVQHTRNRWGNKQLWGSREKGRNKPGHRVPKSTKKK